MKHTFKRIRNTNDERILKEIDKCLSQPLYKLSETEKQSIAEGEKDILNGNVLSPEQAAKERSKWL